MADPSRTSKRSSRPSRWASKGVNTNPEKPPSGVNVHRRALRDGVIWSAIWTPLMYAETYGPPWRNFHPLELGVLVASGFLGGWLIWGYGFYWLFGHAWDALVGPRDRR